MWEGKAVGGPRDGVKVGAGPRWDGRVAKNEGKGTYWPGRYKWDYEELHTWVWKPEVKKK